MKESRLLNILRSLSEEEMKRLAKFAASPYHKVEKNCLPLLNELKKNHPHYDSKNITYENLYKKLYPGKQFNKQVMWNLASAFEKTLLSFIEHEAFRKNGVLRKELVSLELTKRKLSDYSFAEISKIEEVLKEMKIGPQYINFKLKATDCLMEHYQSINKHQYIPEIEQEDFEYRLLDFFRLLDSVLSDQKYFIDMFNIKYNRNIPLTLAKNVNFGKIIAYCESKNYEYLYLIKIYFYSILMKLKPEKSEYFFMMKQLFFENHNNFDRRLKRNLLVTLVNYCVEKRYSKTHNYIQIMFELNKFRLDDGIAFYPENQIPKHLYSQILVNALTLKELKWAKDFVEKYTKKLHPDFQKSMYSLATAYIKFEEKKFNDVLISLNEVNFDDVRDKIHVRFLTAKAYYELNESETLLNFIDSSKHFLTSNTAISDNRKKSYGEFLALLKQFVLIKTGLAKKSVHGLVKQIQNSDDLERKQWLLEKAEELK